MRVPSLEDVLIDAETMVSRDTALRLIHQSPLVRLKRFIRDLQRSVDEETTGLSTRNLEIIKTIDRDNFPKEGFVTWTKSENRGVHRALDKLQKEQASTRRNNSQSKKHVVPTDGIVRFLQLGDIHLDHDYDEVRL